MAVSATATTSAAAILVLLSLLSSAAAARPCKTLFISYTITSHPSSGLALAEIRASTIPVYDSAATARFLAIYRVLRRADESSYRPMIPSSDLAVNSLQDRARDILVVVVGLLFGVGCGGLTAATMYLAWSLITNRYEICGSDGYDDEDEIESTKKLGYVKIPAAADPVHAHKEGYEAN